MKQLFYLSLFLLSSLYLFAQAPQTLNYQGVARSAQGQPYANQAIAVRLKVHDLTALGTVVYSETRNVTTSAFGLFNIVINSAGASAKTGDFININWNSGAKFLETEIDPAGGSNFTSIGTTQMQSVAYALHSAKASKLVLPYSESLNHNSSLLSLSNSGAGYAFSTTNNGTGMGIYNSVSANTGLYSVTTSTNNTHAAIHGYAPSGSSSGIVGESGSATGTGVEANNTGGGLALNVNGKVKIAGGNTAPGAGKVLTSDANGNATWQTAPGTTNKIGFSVRGIALGGLQNMPNNQYYKLHCYSEEYDPGNDYTLYNQASGDLLSSSFKAPVAGFYHFEAKATIMGCCRNDYILKGGAMRMMLKRNGVTSTIVENNVEWYANGIKKDMGPEVSTNVSLQAGDQVWIEISAMTDTGANPVLQWSPIGWDYSKPFHSFSGYLIFAD